MRRIIMVLIHIFEACAIASASLATISAANTSNPKPYMSRTFIVGSLLIYIGTLMRVVCYSTLGKHFTFQLAILKEHSLVTNGPYSIVRHPSYFAISLVFAGLIMSQVGSGSLLRELVVHSGVFGAAVAASYTAMLLVVLMMLLQRMPVEDVALRKHFGAQWDEWAKKVPYRLVPFVY